MLSKDSDLMLAIPEGLPIWPNNCHEPFSISLILPVIRIINYKGPWVIQGIKLSSSYMESVDGGFKVNVGKIPLCTPFMGR